jgi:hypothetical protein
MRAWLFLVGSFAIGLGCGASPGSADGGAPPLDAGSGDSGALDSGPTNDAGVDSGANDSGSGDGGNITGCVGGVPLVYDAPTDRLPHPVAPPPLGDAGSIWLDPAYGTSVLRLTDANTLPGSNLSFQVANEFGHNDWNTDATLFYIQAGNTFLLFNFDPQTMTASRVMSSSKPTQALAMPLGATSFSRTDPNILYGINGLTIASFDFSTQTITNILDLTTIVPAPTDGGHSYALTAQQGVNGQIATTFGGPEQDAMPYVLVYQPATGVHHLLDVTQAKLDGVSVDGGPRGSGIHTLQLDHSGQYVAFIVAGATPGDWVWDTSGGTVQPTPSSGEVGWGSWIHGGGSPDKDELSYFSSPQDSGSLVTPNPSDSQASSSSSWENAIGGALAPIITETMRPPGDDAGWAAWDNELIAIRTDGQLNDAGVSDVWRFAHNFNDYDGGEYNDAFYYLFIPRVSQNGQFVIFDSNWEKTLGIDSKGNFRTDAFIAKLPNPCGP